MMKKRALLSLVAIPIFSLATTFNSFSATTFNSYQESKKIKTKTVAAAVIEFLLRNPKTANKMNPTEQIALDILGDLLKTQGQREHELEYASAGRNQITIDTTDGRQAQFVRNEQGKIFLLVEGVIYPISQNLVNEAEGFDANSNINNEALVYNSFNYDTEVEEYIKSNKIKIASHKEPYIVGNNGEYLYEISNKTETPVEYIGDENYKMLPEKYRDNRVKLPAGMKLTIVVAYPENAIFPMFGFKWVRDLNGNNLYDIEEYKQKKRQFYDNENFYIAIPATVGKYQDGSIDAEVYNDYNGKIIKSGNKYIARNTMDFIFFEFNSNELSPGIYGVNAKLVNNWTNEISNSNSSFMIVEGNSSTKEISNKEKNYREKYISNSTPKGIFFCSSWSDLNNNKKYEYNEFTGLNNNSYSLSKDTLHVSINFPEKSGELIIQSWTKDGKLLGTTTKSYQWLMTNLISPETDPYKSMDFIDMVKINGPGEYKITVTFVEGGTFEKKLVITD